MTNELIVRVERPVIPALVWNKEEIQQNLDEKLTAYTGRVYTPEGIKGAKDDRATVNKYEKQLTAALSAAKKLYTEPLDDFTKSVKAMQAQCKKVSGAIDAQVKAVEQAQRDEKASTLRLVYRDCISELESLIPFERLLDDHWLNKTYDLSKSEKELRLKVETCRNELKLIRDTCGEDTEVCTVEYLKNLCVNDALQECARRRKAREDLRQAEAEREAAERVKAAAPIIIPLSEEERQIAAEAAQAAQSNAFITSDGRMDFESLQAFAEPERKKYRFWVEFTKDDIEWFKKGAAQRGFRYGSVK